MDEILAYKKHDTLLENKLAAQTLIRRVTQYNIMEGKLYRQGLKFPHLKCITTEVGKDVLNMIHGGDGGNHSSHRSLANKAIKYGYFCPTMAGDAEEVAKGCFKCRQFATMTRAPAKLLSIIVGPLIGSMWGIHLVGLLSVAKSQFGYIIVGIDYNSKWIEAVSLIKINTHQSRSSFGRTSVAALGSPTQSSLTTGHNSTMSSSLVGRRRKSFRSGLPQWHIPCQTPSGSRQQENQDTA
ncbi:PREDICTED: uncharacterized protein LOC101300172 [Fragaria vesca subsp. vesca]